MKKRFLLDNDGGFLSKLTDNLELDIAEQVAECPDNVTTYLLCPGGSRFRPRPQSRLRKTWESP